MLLETLGERLVGLTQEQEAQQYPLLAVAVLPEAEEAGLLQVCGQPQARRVEQA